MTASDIFTVAVAATFTADSLAEPLSYWMDKLGLCSRIAFAGHGQVFQCLLDPDSLFHEKTPGVNVVLLKLDDWFAPTPGTATGGDLAGTQASESARDFIKAVVTTAARSERPYVVLVCPVAASSRRNDADASVARDMEQLVISGLAETGGVYTVASDELAATYPVDRIHDLFAGELAHAPYSQIFWVSLATMIARRIYSLRAGPCKVIVLDCDMTLWQGVCGEDGALEVIVDPPRKALQRFMRAQRDAGTLLAVCSKNEQRDVMAVFDTHPDMVLRRADIVSWRVNWQGKPENIRAIAEELQVSLDRMVFVDDDPVECARVQALCPELLVLQLPREPVEIPRYLRHVWTFDHPRVTAEDHLRTRRYQEEARRRHSRERSMTLAEFLSRLELEVRISVMSPSDVSRVSQLTYRTSQFNTTGAPRSEAQILEACREGNLECLVVRVQDRFGSYGLVGVMMFRAEPDTLDVGLLLLSCRALGRGVEHQMAAHLGQLARSRGLGRVAVHFVTCERNRPCLDFLNSIGSQFRVPSGPGFVFRYPAEHLRAIRFEADLALVSQSMRKAPIRSLAKGARAAVGSQFVNHVANELCDARLILADMRARRQRNSRPATVGQYVAPRTPIERHLAHLWSEVLGLDSVGVRDNFFDLGGQSLLGVMLLSRIYDAFNVKLPLVSLFESPTIANQAEFIELQLVLGMEEQQVVARLDEIERLSDEAVSRLLQREAEPARNSHQRRLP
jgi:FkbH-like protein